MGKRKSTIRVMLFRVGKQPEVLDVENSLESFQRLVGGFIEGWGFGRRG